VRFAQRFGSLGVAAGLVEEALLERGMGTRIGPKQRSTSAGRMPNGRDPTQRHWSGNVVRADLSAGFGKGRKTFICKGRRCRYRRTVTQPALDAAAARAKAAGRSKFSLAEI